MSAGLGLPTLIRTAKKGTRVSVHPPQSSPSFPILPAVSTLHSRAPPSPALPAVSAQGPERQTTHPGHSGGHTGRSRVLTPLRPWGRPLYTPLPRPRVGRRSDVWGWGPWGPSPTRSEPGPSSSSESCLGGPPAARPPRLKFPPRCRRGPDDTSSDLDLHKRKKKTFILPERHNCLVPLNEDPLPSRYTGEIFGSPFEGRPLSVPLPVRLRGSRPPVPRHHPGPTTGTTAYGRRREVRSRTETFSGPQGTSNTSQTHRTWTRATFPRGTGRGVELETGHYVGPQRPRTPVARGDTRPCLVGTPGRGTSQGKGDGETDGVREVATKVRSGVTGGRSQDGTQGPY